MAPGQTVLLAVPIEGPIRFRLCPIRIHIDSANAVVESREDNNHASTAASCQIVPEPGNVQPALEWAWTSSSVLPTALNVMMTPSVVDLTGDGVPEVVFASTASTGGGSVEVGYLRALHGTDGSELFTVTSSDYLVNTASSVATGDIDLDGHPEIIACDASGARLIAFEHDGTFKWRSPVLEAVYWGAPALADLDQDGDPEIVIGRQVLDGSGAVLWTGTGGRGSQGSVGPLSAVADVNGDGIPEVVAGNTVYRANGTTLYSSGLPDGYNAVANFDSDPQAEIVLVANGSVYLLEHNLALKWGPVAIPGGGRGGAPTVADYDADGQPEIGVAGAARYCVFETDGTLKWQKVTQDGSSNCTGSSVFDFDGDGSAEVVYRDELKLRIYRGVDGFVLFETAMSSCTWHEYVLVADVDADATAEIVAVANNNCGYGPQRGVYVYGGIDHDWVATRRIWNQHTYHITNVAENGTIPAVETSNWLTPVDKPFNSYRQNTLNPVAPYELPDLTASFIRTVEDLSGTSAIVRVGNSGNVTVGSAVRVGFYDGDPRTGGVLLGFSQTSGPLVGAAFEDVVLALPDGPPPEIWAAVDDLPEFSGVIRECDETNNFVGRVTGPSLALPTVWNLGWAADDGGTVRWYLGGSAGLALNAVDLPTLRLNGTVQPSVNGTVVIPGMEGFDGPVLVIRFPRAAAVQSISLPVASGNPLLLTAQITGVQDLWLTANTVVDVSGIDRPATAIPATVLAPPEVRILGIRPNPAGGSVELRYAVPSSGPVRLWIVSAAGHVVREVFATVSSPGEHNLVWDTADQNARRVPPGVYYLKIQSGTFSGSGRVLVLR